MKRATLQVAALCAFGTLALALFLVSGCYLGQEGTLSTIIENDAGGAAELDAGNEAFSGENEASVSLDASARPSSAELEQLDAGELEQLDGCLPWELALPSSCPRGPQ